MAAHHAGLCTFCVSQTLTFLFQQPPPPLIGFMSACGGAGRTADCAPIADRRYHIAVVPPTSKLYHLVPSSRHRAAPGNVLY